MPIDKADFRRALGHFAAAVTVVTSKLKSGEPAGITVTAFTSLSLEPPLVLICIDKRAKIHDHLEKDHFFAVNILNEDQEAVSRRFAASEGDQFREVGYTDGATGAPLIHDTVTSIECKIVDLLPGGDHTIVVGEVEGAHVREGKPLVYFRGGYASLS
ncbi:MAG: flavin reductase [Planctomycetota bacterium]|nr:MAG: flavin reductase [Planctomycetota bacterium]